MRVAQIMAGAPAGGAELFFERCSAALARAGEEVLPLIRRDPAREARLAAAGLAPQSFRFGGHADVWTQYRLARALRRFSPRVAVAWMGRAARHAPRGRHVLVGRLGGRYPLGQFRRCDHLIANTRGLADWLRAEGMSAARVHILPNFVPDYAGASAPAELGLPDGSRLVLAAGRLHPNKGFDVLLNATTRLPPHVHLAIAGDGPERGRLEGLARQAGIAARVHLLGWRTDMPALLAAADVFACPSRVEPLGNVVLEAFSANRPVVAASAAGPGELIDSGRNGILVPVESGVGLASAIGAVLDDPGLAQRLAAAGRQTFAASFAEAPVIAAWRSFLGSVEKI